MVRAREQELAQTQKTQVTRRGQESQQEPEYFLPTVDISETPDALILRCDMPGVEKQNAEITVDKGTLTVVGTVDPEESGAPIYRETRIGNYRRQFALPEGVDASHISAEMNAGVLTVRISKPEQTKPKRIQITGS
jgi:HSP20 family protein